MGTELNAVTAAQCAARKASFYMGGDCEAVSIRRRDMPRRALNRANKAEHNRRQRRLHGFDD